MNVDWISRQLDYIYFACGVFLTTQFMICYFLHILERDRPKKPSWLLLGLFGLSYGIYEWLELASSLGFGDGLFSDLGLLLMVLAHLFLLEFGRRGTPRLSGARAAWVLYGTLFLLVLSGLPYGLSGLKGSVRYFLALPAGIIATWSFFQEFKKRPHAERSPFLLLSVTVAVFAVSNAASVPESGFALAGVLNNESFLRLTGFPVQLLRSLLALLITLLLGWYSMISRRQGRKSFFGIALVLSILTTIGFGWYVTDFLGGRAVRDLEADARGDILIVVRHIDDSLRLVDSAAQVSDQDPCVTSALITRSGRDLDEANGYFDRYQKDLGLSVVYLMDAQGLTVAASNRNTPGSFVGKSYAFRPYFQQAISGTPGRYFALGVTSGERGYYGSSPVFDGKGTILGVVAAKKNMDFLEDDFDKHIESFLLSPEGVIFMSSNKKLLNRTLWPVRESQRAELSASRQFGTVSFEPLLDRELVGSSYVQFAGKSMYALRLPIGVAGWSVLAMLETRPIVVARVLGIGMTFVIILILIFAFVILMYSDNALRTSVKLSELRRRNEESLNEQLLLQQFVAEINRTLQSTKSMAVVLQQETEIIVSHLGAAFARIWTLNPATNLLELRASGGLYTHLDGAHASVPVGRGMIGRIAEDGTPRFTNTVIGDPLVLDQEWARREGMQAFAGYPLRVEGRVTGVLALFARQPLNDVVLESLGMAATIIASFIYRKHAEDALRESETQYRTLVNSASEIIAVIQDGMIRLVNTVTMELTGYSEEELLSKPFLAFAHPDDRAMILERHQARLRGEAVPKNYDLRLIPKDAKPMWYMVNAVAIKWNGRPATLNFLTNINDRKLAESALMERERFLDVLLNAVPVPVFFKDRSGRYLGFNRAFETFFGETKERLIGKSAFDINPSELAKIYHAKDTELFENGGAQQYESQVKDSRGLLHDVIFYKAVFTDNQGIVRGLIGTILDITVRKRTEEELQEKTRQLEDLTQNLEKKVAAEIAVRSRNEQLLVQQSKMAAMGEMLGAIAHQWRQPLNTLGMCVQNISDACTHGDLDRSYLDRTILKSMDQIQHMSTTIDDFRNFFLPDKERSRFDSMAAVGDVLSLLSAQLTSNNIAFRLTCHTHARSFEQLGELEVCPEKTIDGVRNEFGHVILNLIINARDAIATRREAAPDGAPGQGLITFDFFNSAGTVIIEVGDNGTGIPEAIMPRIFEPYFTVKDPSKGTGIGLYMSKIMIEDHMKGNLTAKNGPEGAVFSIRLPQAERMVVS